MSAELDGAPADPAAIPLVDDGGVHRVRVVLGAPPKVLSGSALDAGAGGDRPDTVSRGSHESLKRIWFRR